LSRTGANVRSRNLQGMKCVPIYFPGFSFCASLAAARWAKHKAMRRRCEASICTVVTRSQHNNLEFCYNGASAIPVTKENRAVYVRWRMPYHPGLAN